MTCFFAVLICDACESKALLYARSPPSLFPQKEIGERVERDSLPEGLRSRVFVPALVALADVALPVG